MFDNTVCLRVILLLFLGSITTTVSANLISGTLSLPNTVVAGSGGVTIKVSGIFLEFPAVEDIVTIPEGATSTNFLLNFSGQNDQEIIFECLSGCFDLDLTTQGAWHETDGVVSNFFGTEYSGLIDHNVDVILEAGSRFAGQLSFPEGFKANGGEFVIVVVSSNNIFAFERYSYTELLTPGQSTLDFSIGVPQKNSMNWELSASCFVGCIESIPSDDNYATTMSGNPLSLDESLAFPYSATNDYFELEVTLIGTIPVKNVVIPPLLYLLDE